MKITAYSFGNLTVNDQKITSDVIICHDEVFPNWRRKKGHQLAYHDIKDAVHKYNPELLIIGTGAFGLVKVPKKLQQKLQEKGIKVMIAKTQKACDLYNENQHQNAMAALHLNC